MAKAPNYIRVGQQVIHRNQIRHRLASEVQQLVTRIELLKHTRNHQAVQLIESYEAMIQERCSALAHLSRSLVHAA